LYFDVANYLDIITRKSNLEVQIMKKKNFALSPTLIRAGASGESKIAFVSGNFNIVHPGHLRMLKFASENSDILVVAIYPDGTSDISVPEELRAESLEAIGIVDHVLRIDIPMPDLLRDLKPDIIVKGKEHENGHNIEESILDSYGGKLVFASGSTTFSSSNLLRREIQSRQDKNQIRFPSGFQNRHKFNHERLIGQLKSFSNLRVAVFGDLIVDSYIDCEPVGMSQEDPTIVITPLEESMYIGGASIVAAHARNLGADTHLFTVVGDDVHAEFALEKLDSQGVVTECVVDSTRPTTLKTRYRAKGKTLLRVNKLRPHAIGRKLMDQLFQRFEAVIDTIDLLMFSDFNYGCLPQVLVSEITELCKAKGVVMVADSQASSQYADISRFKGMKLITPTEREARLALQDFDSGLAVVAQELRNKADAEHVFITLGEDGLLIHSSLDFDQHTDRLSVFNLSPVDVAGAGDSLFATASMALCAGANIWESAYLGSLVAGCQVATVGNRPADIVQIMTQLSDKVE
jgi:rfaE bifunctional protein kinase chain/domain